MNWKLILAWAIRFVMLALLATVITAFGTWAFYNWEVVVGAATFISGVCLVVCSPEIIRWSDKTIKDWRDSK